MTGVDWGLVSVIGGGAGVLVTWVWWMLRPIRVVAFLRDPENSHHAVVRLRCGNEVRTLATSDAGVAWTDVETGRTVGDGEYGWTSAAWSAWHARVIEPRRRAEAVAKWGALIEKLDTAAKPGALQLADNEPDDEE